MSRVLGPGILAEHKTVATTTLKWAGLEVCLEESVWNDGRTTKEVITIVNDPISHIDFGVTGMSLYASDLPGLLDLLTQIQSIRERVKHGKV